MPVRDRPGTEGWDRRGGEFGDLTEVGSEVGMMVAALRTFSLSSEVAWIYSSRLSSLQRRISRERKKESIAEIPKGIVLYCTVLLRYTVLNDAATTDDLPNTNGMETASSSSIRSSTKRNPLT